MRYGVDFTPQADEDPARMPLPLQSVVDQEVTRLAEDPAGLGRRATFPYRPGQVYPFRATAGNVRYVVTVFFRYGDDDERRLVVEALGWYAV